MIPALWTINVSPCPSLSVHLSKPCRGVTACTLVSLPPHHVIAADDTKAIVQPEKGLAGAC